MSCSRIHATASSSVTAVETQTRRPESSTASA